MGQEMSKTPKEALQKSLEKIISLGSFLGDMSRMGEYQSNGLLGQINIQNIIRDTSAQLQSVYNEISKLQIDDNNVITIKD